MSRLRFKGLTANQLAKALQQASRETKNDVFSIMREETHEIKEISVKQAPVDDGELEAAHRVVINRNQTDKAHYLVEVGGTVNGVDVDEYAEIIHEGIGWSKLGPRSVNKQATVAPYVVGPQFLTRAFDERIGQTVKRVQEALVNGVRRYVS